MYILDIIINISFEIGILGFGDLWTGDSLFGDWGLGIYLWL